MEIVPLGDSALIVRVRERFEDAPEETLNEVLQMFQQLRSAAIPGVTEVAPAYTTVAVFCDPMQAAKARGQSDRAFDWLNERVQRVIAATSDRGRRGRTTKGDVRLVEIQSATTPSLVQTSMTLRDTRKSRQKKSLIFIVRLNIG